MRLNPLMERQQNDGHFFRVTHPIGRQSPGARRARRYRSRQRRGSWVISVSITQPEMDALVRLKLLEPELRHDRQAVTSALRSYISDRLWREEMPT
jgi:hypothetical protein